MSQTRMTALLLLGLVVVAAPTVADHLPVLSEDAKLLPSGVEGGDWYGEKTAVDGDTIVVGAKFDDDLGEEAGAAYVFRRSEDGAWVQTAKLHASDGEAGDYFGVGVGIDGDTVVVGAQLDDDLGENSGSAYVFERAEPGVWSEVAKLLASDGGPDNWLGESVAIDGGTIVAGAELRDDFGFYSGAAYVFERDESGVWLETAKLLASDGEERDAFGSDVAIDGERIAVGARGDDDGGFAAGAAYLFERSNDGTWVETAKLRGEDGDSFGAVVALSGDIVAASATSNDDQAADAGAAYVFERTEEGPWVEVAKLYSAHPALLDGFGRVALSGETLVVGSLGFLLPGTADLFVRSRSGEWVNSARILPSDPGLTDQFGLGGSIDGDTVVMGARLDDDQGIDSGSAYVFSLLNSVLTMRIDPTEVFPGEELSVRLALEHKRPETVTVSFQLSIEDAAGAVVASRTTAPTILRQGDVLSQELTATIPVGTPPGTYLARMEAVEMPPWINEVTKTFEILPPMPD